MKFNLNFKIRIIIEPDGNEFHAYCPALKGLHTCGATQKEALHNAKDAIISYLTSTIKHGDPIPEGIIKRIEVPGKAKERVSVTKPRTVKNPQHSTRQVDTEFSFVFA